MLVVSVSGIMCGTRVAMLDGLRIWLVVKRMSRILSRE